MIVDMIGFEASKSQCLVTIPPETRWHNLNMIGSSRFGRFGGALLMIKIWFKDFTWIYSGTSKLFNTTKWYLTWFGSFFQQDNPEIPPAPPHHRCDSTPTHSAPVGDQRAICFRVNFTNMTTHGKQMIPSRKHHNKLRVKSKDKVSKNMPNNIPHTNNN